MAFAQPTVSGVLAGRHGVRSFAPTAPTAPTGDPFQRTQVADDAFISNLFRQFQAPVSFEQPFEQQAEQALMQPQQVFGPARSVPRQNPIVPAANIVRDVANIGAQFTDSPQLTQVADIARDVGMLGSLARVQTPAQAAAALAPPVLRHLNIGGSAAGAIAGGLQGLAQGDLKQGAIGAGTGAAQAAIFAALPPLGIINSVLQAITGTNIVGEIISGPLNMIFNPGGGGRAYRRWLATLTPEQRAEVNRQAAAEHAARERWQKEFAHSEGRTQWDPHKQQWIHPVFEIH